MNDIAASYSFSALELDLSADFAIQEIQAYIEALGAEREDWESKELKSSNERLYMILLKCYNATVAMLGNSDAQKKMKGAFEALCDSQSIKFKDSTKLSQRVVRVVWGDCGSNPDTSVRKRISVYGRAIQVLIEDSKVNADNFIQTIKDAGGVEEIHRAAKAGANSLTVKELDKVGKITVTTAPVIESIRSESLSKKVDSGKTSDVVLLVATYESDGSFSVRRVVQNETALKNVFTSIGRDENATGVAQRVLRDAEAKAEAEEAAREESLAANRAKQASEAVVKVSGMAWSSALGKAAVKPEEATESA